MRLDERHFVPYANGDRGGRRSARCVHDGKDYGVGSASAGVHWIYAPVADVNNNPGNPIINTRSFGEDAARVSEFVTAYVRGVEENGGLATAKHFPGHGDTAADSHIDLPVIRADRARLESLELVPFRRCDRGWRWQRHDRTFECAGAGTGPQYACNFIFEHFEWSFAPRSWLSGLGGHGRDGHGRYYGSLRAG